MNSNSPLSKIIWLYWHQGFENAPDLVKECVHSWQKLNLDWEIQLLDKENLLDYIDPIDIPEEKLKPRGLAFRSDLIRLKLLIQYGGVWADPTCFCIRPLDDWVFEASGSGLFLFHKPGRDRIVSSWFIASAPQNSMLKKIYASLCKYINSNTFRNRSGLKSKTQQLLERAINRSPWLTLLWFSFPFTKGFRLFPYFALHYMFFQKIVFDRESRKIWKKIPKISADGPHRLQRIGLTKPAPQEAKDLIEGKKVPLFKLTWKVKESPSKDSVLQYLFQLNTRP